MDAETMTNEELSALAVRLAASAHIEAAGGESFGHYARHMAMAREAVRWADERATLRAQAKGEPVAWQVRSRLAPSGDWSQWGDFTSATHMEYAVIVRRDRGLEVETRILYTAPPPDHAEALAEDVERALGQYDDDAADDPDYVNPADTVETIRAALNRYKGARNG